MGDFNLHRLNYEITEEQFENALRSPGHRSMKVQLPDYVEGVMAVGHTLPAGKLFLFRLRWLLRTLSDIRYMILEKITGDSPVRSIKSYIPPDDHIQFIYNDKTNMLSMEIVTAYDRRSYRKIIIIYTSTKKDLMDKRDNALKSIGIK